MTTKRESPYHRMQRYFREWAQDVVYARRKTMFLYKKSSLDTGWSLSQIYERTIAANQLGYEVIVQADNDGLHFKYIEKRPTEIPWDARR